MYAVVVYFDFGNGISVDGVYTEWSGWGKCDVTCGGGIQWRNRSCDGPYYGGANCIGPDTNSQACNTHECPGKCFTASLEFT